MTELKRLAKNCEYGELTNSIFKDRIVEGINNDSTRAGLLREKDLSLERCVEICKAAEVADKHMEVLTDQSREPRDINALSRGKNYKEQRAQGLRGTAVNQIRNLTTDQIAQGVVEETIATINAQQWENSAENVTN